MRAVGDVGDVGGGGGIILVGRLSSSLHTKINRSCGSTEIYSSKGQSINRSINQNQLNRTHKQWVGPGHR